MAEVDLGQALDWEGIVIDDGPSFELLDAGYYPFRVESLERERFDGSAKMASCPRAKLTLKVTAGDREFTITDRIMLNTKMQWRVARFFECLGFTRDDEGNMHMHWNELDDKSGWLKLKVREYTDKDGNKKQANDVDEYCRPSDAEKAYNEWAARYQPAQQPAPVAEQPAQQPMQTAMPIPAQPQQFTNPTTGSAWSL
jgi:hypothetical protein